MDATAIFGSGRDPTIAQETARMVVVFCYGLAVVRLFGRRVFGRWSALDIIVSIVIGSNLSRIITGNAPVAATLVATTGLLLLHFLLAQASARSRWVSLLVEGRAIDLVQDSRLDDGVRRHHGVSHADLDEAIRRNGLAELADAARITLEPSGTITVAARGKG